MKFKKFESLNSKKELNLVKKNGFIVKNNFLQFKYLEKENSKFAFMINKKIGNSVVRNKIKRKLRAVLIYLNIEFNLHLIIIVKENFNISFLNLIENFKNLLQKCYKN